MALRPSVRTAGSRPDHSRIASLKKKYAKSVCVRRGATGLAGPRAGRRDDGDGVEDSRPGRRRNSATTHSRGVEARLTTRAATQLRHNSRLRRRRDPSPRITTSEVDRCR